MLKSLLLLVWFSMHPVHVSLMSMDYSENEKVIRTYLMVYFDDFKLDYTLMTGEKEEFDFVNDIEGIKKKIELYLDEKLAVYSGKKRLNGRINDVSLSENELKMNMVYHTGGKSNVFTVRNSILTEIYKDQANLLIFRSGDFEEGVKLTSGQNEKQFVLK